ncbi:MAG: hypothetical protein JWQ90_1719 [Hydrocarboniphaga sp.]|uniref:ECF-type sigma factor n=1 Tax=Hydrocarboniphaga sp. TaxID=2033016 RepID=UPI002619A450|nr:ECF-type sigma factor [Hydrocarboniphaga sp.]MDB5969269.1 hypothetical protein [Hydrocarboniphaga sp.]
MAEVTHLLLGAAAGKSTARDALYTLVYDELRKLARHSLAQAAPCTQLDPCSLVNEAYLRMAHRQDLAFDSRHAFFAYAARVMRAVVVDHARGRHAEKRGGGAAAVTLTTSVEDNALCGIDLVAIDDALQVLARLDPRAHQVFEMHFFAGLAVDDIVTTLALSPATVKRELRKARAFVIGELGQNGAA